MKRLQGLALKLKELIIKNQFILYLAIFLIAFFVYLWIQSTPTFLDPDSFYHLKMTKLIAERGQIMDFPWLQSTVLKDYFVDHHFLYHVLAIPFIKVFGDFSGFKFYTVILAALFILGAYSLFKKFKVKYPEIFALILLFSPALMFRISLAKATAFSLILLFAGIYFIFKRKYWLLFFLSFIYVWSYGGFILILVMALIYALVSSIYSAFLSPNWVPEFALISKLKRIKKYLFNLFKNLLSLQNLKIIAASLLGIVSGLIINPYFPKNLKFYWQQLVQIGIINYRTAVNVGGEWYPYKFLELIPDSGVAIIIGALCLILFFFFWKKQKSESFFFLITTILFFLLTLKSKRYVEYFIPNLVFFSAFTFKAILEGLDFKEILASFKKENHYIVNLVKILSVYILLIFLVIIIKNALLTRQSFKGGISFQAFAGISKYLKENAKEKEIIMQTDWDDFPMLLYQNDKNYYIVGLDPTFMYNYNPALYKLFADITTAKKTDNLYQEIKDKFKASYFIVDKDRQQLEKNLQKDGNFIKVYGDADGEIYKLK